MKTHTRFFRISSYAICFVTPLLLCFALTFYYRLHQNIDIHQYENELQSLGRKSIPSGDVPVACMLLYHDSIIGEGYNDVSFHNNPSGHAEINAIRNCFEKMGYVKFKTLNRRYLTLITTYEPCPMCKGAIEEYDIEHIVFSLNKTSRDKLKYLEKDILYYKNLTQSTNKQLQYNLFEQCPTFHGKGITL